MILVGVAGNKGSGKNTFATKCIEFLSSEYGRVGYEMSWASLLKESAAATLGVHTNKASEWADSFKNNYDVLLTDNGKTVHSISGREFLQNYGTEAHRDIFDDDFWVNAFWDSNTFQSSDIVFITDCRFSNEVRSVKEHGGILVKIENDRIDNNDEHASEQGIEMENVDVVIMNHSTIENLQEQAEVFVTSLLT